MRFVVIVAMMHFLVSTWIWNESAWSEDVQLLKTMWHLQSMTYSHFMQSASIIRGSKVFGQLTHCQLWSVLSDKWSKCKVDFKWCIGIWKLFEWSYQHEVQGCIDAHKSMREMAETVGQPKATLWCICKKEKLALASSNIKKRISQKTPQSGWFLGENKSLHKAVVCITAKGSNQEMASWR